MIEEISKDTADTLAGLSRSVDSLANVVMDNRLALDYLLAEQGGVCAVINKTCCTYVNNSGMIETNIKKIYEQAEWLHKYNQQGQGIKEALTSWFPGLTWLLPLLGPLITLLLLLLIGPCLFNLLVKFVSSRLKQFHIKLMMLQGFQPIPESDVEADQHTASAVASGIPLQPLDRIGREFRGSQ